MNLDEIIRTYLPVTEREKGCRFRMDALREKREQLKRQILAWHSLEVNKITNAGVQS